MRIVKRCLLFLLLLASALAAGSCRSIIREAFQPPKVRVTDVFLTSNPLDDPKRPWTFLLTIAVTNPNGYPLHVAHVAYSAVLGRETVAEGEQRENIRIEASGVTAVKVPVTVLPEAFQVAMRHVLQARRLEYEFNGSVSLQAPVIGVVRIPFSKTGAMDPADLLRRKGIGIR